MSYATTAPARKDIDAMTGSAVLEFGTDWCGYCQGAQPLIGEAFSRHPGVRRIQVEDGPGRALGRSFRVKLWPTLIFLRDGAEVARVVRPTKAFELDDAFAALA
ncbi:thioredoxin family protein [Paraburkholderia acidipaludis]|uniref:thioredoxin family protein n=1 Tax=Paraburkholderia acidipaludis TaxID=660537 RepID=UPI0004833F1D|nr:thioredoxin family protein [Paraburkholderia acidipaludis]